MTVLRSKRIVLRSVEANDMLVLWSWRNSTDFKTNCSTRRNSLTLEEFIEEWNSDMARDRLVQFIIFVKERAVGTIYAYSMNKTDEHVFFTTFIEKPFQGLGYGPEAVALFIKYLFDNFPIYKVYTDVYSYNTQSLLCLRKGGFIEEGKFVGHRLFEGVRYDMYRLSLFRNHPGKLQHILGGLGINNTSGL